MSGISTICLGQKYILLQIMMLKWEARHRIGTHVQTLQKRVSTSIYLHWT